MNLKNQRPSKNTEIDDLFQRLMQAHDAMQRFAPTPGQLKDPVGYPDWAPDNSPVDGVHDFLARQLLYNRKYHTLPLEND